ncbi:MAG: hypothetical protein AAGE52_10820 [Myxococcota bacterium]
MTLTSFRVITFRAVTWLAFATACTSEGPECEETADCVARCERMGTCPDGPLECVAGICQERDRWDCERQLVVPNDVTIQIRMRAMEGFDQIPVPSEVTVCEYRDIDCNAPVAGPFVSESAPPHYVDFEVASRPGLYLEIRPTEDLDGMTLLPSIVDFDDTAALSAEFGTSGVAYNLLTTESLNFYADAGSIGLDPALGMVFGGIDTCEIGVGGEGLSVRPLELPETSVWYLRGVPRFDGETAADGRWGMVNVPSGAWTFEILDGAEVVGTIRRIARGGWRTEALYLPYVVRESEGS